MSNFVTDAVTLPYPKSNLQAVPDGANPAQYVSGDDWNAVCQAEADIKAYITQASGVTPGPYTSANITVDAQGRVTAASSGGGAGVPTSRTITAGTGLTGGGDLTADRTLALANTAVTPGSYTLANITIDAQGRITIASSGTASGDASGDFGDGHDGNAVMDGSTSVVGTTLSGSVYTLTRTAMFHNLTINSGVTLKPDGWPLYATGTLTNNGGIKCNAPDSVLTVSGGPAVTGSKFLPVNFSGGTASTLSPNVFVNTGGAGGIPGATIGQPGQPGTSGGLGRGGGGGGGGNNNPFTAAGSGGNTSPTVNPLTAIRGDFRQQYIAFGGRNLLGDFFTVGTAGADGGAGGVGTAGAAGFSGGWVAVAARIVAGSGVWEAKGAAGGAGGGGGVGGGGGGGGGGGAGGLFFLRMGSGTAPFLNIAGGIGGAGGAASGGAGAGASGGNGGDGYAAIY